MSKRHELGQYLKHGRKKAGFSMMEVARYIGLETDSIIAHYESGFRVIPSKYLAEVADFLDLDVNILINLKVKIEEEKIIDEVYERRGKAC